MLLLLAAISCTGAEGATVVTLTPLSDMGTLSAMQMCDLHTSFPCHQVTHLVTVCIIMSTQYRHHMGLGFATYSGPDLKQVLQLS